MTFWSIAPWVIALVVAAGLGVYGRFGARHRQDNHTADAEQRSYTDDN